MSLGSADISQLSASAPARASTPSSLQSGLYTPPRKRKFDDRSFTKVSLSLKAHASPSKTSLVESPPDEDRQIFQWLETTAIGHIINSADFVIKHGNVTCIEACVVYIAIGTDKGDVIVFNYHQAVEFVLQAATQAQQLDVQTPRPRDLYVTTLSFSSDSSVVVAGYFSGEIILWELENSESGSAVSPYFYIKPITLQMRFEKGKEGHIADCPITSVKFIGASNLQFVSMDLSGLAFYHHGFRRFLNKYFVTHKLMGKNDANSSNTKLSNIVYDAAALPYGTAPQITDQLGVLAVITGGMLAVVSILSLNNQDNALLRTHYRITKPKALKLNPNTTGCLSWHPCMKLNDGKITNAKLAYSWNNCVTVLEIDNNSFTPNMMKVVNDLKDKDKAVPTIPVKYKARHVLSKDYNIISVNWTSERTLCIFVQNPKAQTTICIFHYDPTTEKGLELVGEDNLQFKDISRLKFFKKGAHPTRNDIKDILFQSYRNTINLVKHRAIVLVDRNAVNKEIHIGRPISWADKLVTLLQAQNYYDALMKVCNYYNNTDVGNSIALGLPPNDHERQILVKPYLIKIMNESLPHLFEAERRASHEKYVKLFLEIAVMLDLGINNLDMLDFILEEIFEKVGSKPIFFSCLEEYLYDGSITKLPPVLLKELVQYYTEQNKGEQLTEILCVIDISQLDIDLTIHLCEKYDLNECLIFIWNYLLHDYVSPFLRFLDSIVSSKADDGNYQVFTYMAYILTGRQYPIDRPISAKEEKSAKMSICNILFSHNIASRSEDSNTFEDSNAQEGIFPNLFMLLKLNAFEMLSTLNEFFEDSILNESSNSSITRQYIIEALIDIFDSQEAEFEDTDRTNLSIFVARNYPKYSQFIRLSDSILERVTNSLLNCTDSQLNGDCELALQCLLAVYEPESEADLVERLRHAKYYNVLINIFRAEGRYHNVLNLWLDKHNQGSAEEFSQDSFSVVLEDAFRLTKPGLERVQLLSTIKSKFEQFFNIDRHMFVYIISQFEPALHEEALKIKDNETRYLYLKDIFTATNVRTVPNFPKAIFNYIELLCFYNRTHLPKFIGKYIKLLKDDDESFDKCKQLLESNNQIESLTILLLSEGKHELSLHKLLNHLRRLVENIADSKDEFERYFHLFIEGCNAPELDNEVAESELTLNEQMWLRIVKMLIEFSNDNQEDKAYFNEKIYEAFRKLSDSKLSPSNNNKVSFFKIFNRFLEDSQQLTTLSNIRRILQEVIVSYSYESETLKIGMRIINDGIYKRLKVIKLETVRGWSIKSKSCTSCGRKLIGSHSDPGHWVAWEQKQLHRLSLINLNDFFNFSENGDFHHLQLIFFKCEHGYHKSCLEKMNSSHCVLCVPE